VIKTLLIILASLFSGCAGQVISVPVATQGRDRAGNLTRSVKSVPIFKNTGNLANAKFNYSGPYGRISFSADAVDNAIATLAIHEGISSDIRAAGSLVGTALAGAAGIITAQGLTTTAVTQSNNSRIVSTNAANNAAKVSIAKIPPVVP
jgi:hypothetical protein